MQLIDKRVVQDFEFASQYFPLASLPTGLRKGHLKRWNPPVIHLAFAVTLDWAAAYAAKHGLREEVPKVESDHEDAYSDEEEEKEYRDNIKALRAKIVEDRKRNSLFDKVSVGCRLEKIANHINENAGIESIEVTWADIYPYPCIMAGRTCYGLLSMRTNYDDGPMPSPYDIIDLFEYLEAEDFAAWDLDAIKCGWKRR